jgi:hypothetical protein
MVSSITPGAAGANALGVDQRLQRPGAPPQRREGVLPAPGDRVELSRAALTASGESVRAGIAQVQEALALGLEAQAMLVRVSAAAKSGSQGELDAALSGFAERLEAAISRGVTLAAGGAVQVQAEPDSAPVAIEGVDLRLKAEPGADDVLSVSAQARADDAALPQAVQRSLEKLQDAMSRLLDAMRSLEAHQGFLGAAEAASVRSDLDADSARLMALQVRQGLESANNLAIANTEPQAVLSLFRA